MNNPKKILIIDDSEVVTSCICTTLEQKGFIVVCAANGLDGIEQVYRQIPDAIIMDIEMPIMDGFQATRLLKNTRGFKEIPIIIHTSLTGESDRIWAIECGADAFLIKDFDHIEHLINIVETLSQHTVYPLLEFMQEDGKTITKEQIIAAAGAQFDRTLFQYSAINRLISANNYISSLEKTAETIFDTLQQTCDYHIALLALKYQKTTLVFALPKRNVVHSDLKDFSAVCLNDFYECFPLLSQEPLEEFVLNIDDRSDFYSLRLDKEKIRSYLFFELKNQGNQTIATLHFGHFTNHYFTEKLVNHVQMFLSPIALLLHNALYLRHLIEKESKIRGVFSKFVPAQIIDSLLEKQDVASLLIGEKRSVAVLFSDIRSFTTISESNNAEDVVSCLNHYFDLMAQAIKTEGGIIDKFIGDAILAIFGAPTSYEDNAMRAVKAAIGMIDALPNVNTAKLKLPKNGFQIGIGINDGIAIVGNIGSKEKFDYTVIGDTVNLAARLEGLTKHYNQQIIISEEVKKKVCNAFFVREIDKVKVKGKEQATAMYSIPLLNREYFTTEVIDDYQKGLSMYKIKNWLTAMEYFKKVLTHIPDDYICEMYIKRCNEFMQKPPEKDWDGSIELDFK